MRTFTLDLDALVALINGRETLEHWLDLDSGGVTLPMVYRFRPWNNDPGKCLMEVILLRPNPVGEPAPPPAKMHMLSDDEDWGCASELGWLGLVFDQDVVNVARMQQGLKTTRRKGVVMSVYQESRIRHMHNTLSQYLSQP